jgi:hypothetical protein
VRLRCGEADLEAWTYHSTHGKSGRKPSRRYLGLLLRGAHHHGLPASYVETLRLIELARDEREAQIPLPLSGVGPT